jgi:hypothetical protein
VLGWSSEPSRVADSSHRTVELIELLRDNLERYGCGALLARRGSSSLGCISGQRRLQVDRSAGPPTASGSGDRGPVSLSWARRTALRAAGTCFDDRWDRSFDIGAIAPKLKAPRRKQHPEPSAAAFVPGATEGIWLSWLDWLLPLECSLMNMPTICPMAPISAPSGASLASLKLNRSSDASEGATKSLLDGLMTAREIAGIPQMRVSTVQGYARRGLLPSVKVGGHRRFIRSEVERAIARLLPGRAGPPAAREHRPAGPDRIVRLPRKTLIGPDLRKQQPPGAVQDCAPGREKLRPHCTS